MNTKQVIQDNERKVRETILTEEEKEAAYYEGQKKKFFKLKHGHLWNVSTETEGQLKTKN